MTKTQKLIKLLRLYDSEVICKPFRNVTGIPSGRPNYVAPAELERISDLFEEEGDVRWMMIRR